MLTSGGNAPACPPQFVPPSGTAIAAGFEAFRRALRLRRSDGRSFMQLGARAAGGIMHSAGTFCAAPSEFEK